MIYQGCSWHMEALQHLRRDSERSKLSSEESAPVQRAGQVIIHIMISIKLTLHVHHLDYHDHDYCDDEKVF